MCLPTYSPHEPPFPPTLDITPNVTAPIALGCGMPARLPLVSAITAAAAATRRPGVRLTQHDVACRRPLSHTAVLRADDSGSGRAGAPVSHYDALGVSAAASHADIKKCVCSILIPRSV